MERYFAYGSNMSSRQLATRCPSARPLAPARLLEHRLTFFLEDASWDEQGVAGVVSAAGQVVEGVVYALDAVDLVALDAYEEVDEGDYTRARQVVHTADGPLEAWIYLPGPEVATYVAPSPRYVACLLEGAREHGLAAAVAFLEGLDPLPTRRQPREADPAP